MSAGNSDRHILMCPLCVRGLRNRLLYTKKKTCFFLCAVEHWVVTICLSREILIRSDAICNRSQVLVLNENYILRQTRFTFN